MTKKVIMQLGELTCPSCLTKIQNAVEKEPGVENVKVLFNSGKVKAEFDDQKVTTDKLSDVVSGLGYEVEGIKVKDL